MNIVRKKDTGKIYAMKTLSKSKIKRDNKVENILNERAILERVAHPFIVQMKYAFQNVITIKLNKILTLGGLSILDFRVLRGRRTIL